MLTFSSLCMALPTIEKRAVLKPDQVVHFTEELLFRRAA
jgi:hypothetical protein